MHVFSLFILLILFSIEFCVKQGLIPAINMLFPTVKHRYCVKHIYSNFKADHKRLELNDALWRYVGVTTIREFERRMQELKYLDLKAWEYLVDINPTQWLSLILPARH